MADLNLITRTTEARPYRRVGRGQGSKRGKQAGRGGKGQTARAGHKLRPEYRDIIKKLPKRRGYGKNRSRTVNESRPTPVAISLTKIDARFDSGAEITLKSLREAGMIGRTDKAVKIVAGETTKKLTVKGCGVTASAKESIEKAGGSVSK